MTHALSLNTANTLSSVLTQLIEQFKITEAELSRAINLPRATINRIKSGKILDPKSSTLSAIANYFNISIDQLLGHVPLLTMNSKNANIARVILVEWEELQNLKGNVCKYLEDTTNYTKWTYFDCEHPDTVNLMFALKIQGEAMWPYFDDKSIVLINPNVIPQNRNFVIAYISETDEVIIRQLLIDGKSKMLSSINSAFPTIKLNSTDKIVGVIVHAKKNF